jgi:hypothetical protein
MRETKILTPYKEGEATFEEVQQLYTRAQQVRRYLKDMECSMDSGLSHDCFLRAVGLKDDQEYHSLIRATLTQDTVLLRRKPCDIRVNNFCPGLSSAWQSNMDVQFCLSIPTTSPNVTGVSLCSCSVLSRTPRTQA